MTRDEIGLAERAHHGDPSSATTGDVHLEVPGDWMPPDEAGRAILRVILAVKARRTGRDAA